MTAMAIATGCDAGSRIEWRTRKTRTLEAVLGESEMKKKIIFVR
jgi:hypothetical protein